MKHEIQYYLKYLNVNLMEKICDFFSNLRCNFFHVSVTITVDQRKMQNMHTYLLSGHIYIRARSPNALSALHYNYISKVMHYDYHYHFFVKSYDTLFYGKRLS